MIFAYAAQHTCPDLDVPDLAMFDDDGSNLSHTRPHNPDGLAPDGGHPRLRRETLLPTNNRYAA